MGGCSIEGRRGGDHHRLGDGRHSDFKRSISLRISVLAALGEELEDEQLDD